MATDTIEAVPPPAGPGTIDTAVLDTTLQRTAQALVSDDKGLLAIDESVPTCNLSRCAHVTEDVLRVVFRQLEEQGVVLEGMLLKPNMILPGLDCPVQDPVQSVAAATRTCLRRTVPAAVAGIAFLSGGQSGDLATARLAAINTGTGRPLPWPVSFSFGRAIQQSALTIWDGQDAYVVRAQQALQRRVASNRDARRDTDTLPPGSLDAP